MTPVSLRTNRVRKSRPATPPDPAPATAHSVPDRSLQPAGLLSAYYFPADSCPQSSSTSARRCLGRARFKAKSEMDGLRLSGACRTYTVFHENDPFSTIKIPWEKIITRHIEF